MAESPEVTFRKLATQLTDSLPRRLTDFASLLDQWGRFMQRVHVGRFQQQIGTEGERWAPYAPLTLRIYGVQGKSTTRTGGDKLPRSFEKGGAGNVWDINGPSLTYGSALRGGTVYTVEGFQADFYSPSDPADTAARNRIRAWMAHTLGLKNWKDAPPQPGNDNKGRLHHPARSVVGLNDDHWEQIGNLTATWVEERIDEVLRAVANG